MRITYILDTFGGGGKERRCLQLIKGLNRNNYNDIQVIILKNEVFYKELYETSAQVHIINRKEEGLNILHTSRIIRSLLKDFNSEIVQAWGIVSALCCIIIRPTLHFHFLASYVADVYSPVSTSFIINKLCCLMAEKIIGNSKAALKAYKIPDRKSILIYNGYDEKRLTNKVNVIIKKNGLGIFTPHVVAMIASFSKTKDWDCFIHSAMKILDVRKDITFLAVGDGIYKEKYEKMIPKPYSCYIKFLGARNDVDEVLQICNITVLTSTNGESFSNSILESMAFGVPVIASNAGGTPELISEGENGFLLNQNDIDELSQKINELINNTEMRRCFSDNAKKTVHNQFMLSQMTAKFISLYNNLYDLSK